MLKKIKEYAKFKYFKGGQYEIIGIAKEYGTNANVVIYKNAYGNGEMESCLESVFHGDVEHNDEIVKCFVKMTEQEIRAQRLIDTEILNPDGSYCKEHFPSMYEDVFNDKHKRII